jgi:hypothetical protein
MCAYNLSTREAEAGELWLQGQPGLHSETMSEKNCFINPKTMNRIVNCQSVVIQREKN